MKKSLLIIFCVFTFILYLYLNFKADSNNIEGMIGKRIDNLEMSIEEHSSVLNFYESYIEDIKNKNYEEAYLKLNYSYRNAVPFNEYCEIVSKKDYDSYLFKSISKISKTAYNVQLESSEDNNSYIILRKEDYDYCLIPDSFLTLKKDKE